MPSVWKRKRPVTPCVPARLDRHYTEYGGSSMSTISNGAHTCNIYKSSQKFRLREISVIVQLIHSKHGKKSHRVFLLSLLHISRAQIDSLSTQPYPPSTSRLLVPNYCLQNLTYTAWTQESQSTYHHPTSSVATCNPASGSLCPPLQPPPSASPCI